MKEVYYSKTSIVNINSACTNKPEGLPNKREYICSRSGTVSSKPTDFQYAESAYYKLEYSQL
jgi:hypothetical protein